VETPKATPKRLAPKTKAKRRSPAKKPPYRQMTAALARERAVGWGDGRKIDIVAFLRDLR
jgi:hypothetical protein